MNELWFVSPSDFLGRMGAADRHDMLLAAERRVFANHAFIFQAGSPGQNVYLLTRGRVKIFGLSPAGKMVLLWFCLPGEVFGLAEVPRGGPREVYAQACTECEVASLSQPAFKQFIGAHPQVAMLVIELLACRLRVLGDMLLNLAADDVTTRVLKMLMRLSARYGRETSGGIRLDIHLTHQEIADMIGATRQTVTAVLGDLRRQGAVHVEDHCICIESQELIESMLRECAAHPDHGLAARKRLSG